MQKQVGQNTTEAATSRGTMLEIGEKIPQYPKFRSQKLKFGLYRLETN